MRKAQAQRSYSRCGARGLGLIVVAWALLAAVVAACNNSTAAPGLLSGLSSGPSASISACAVPTQGCPCAHDGQAAACGTVLVRSGNYVACSMGEMTCSGGSWGSCLGQQVTTKYVPVAGGLHAETLGVSQGCGADNPCDPYCNEYVDTPAGGLDAGAAFLATDAGLQLAPTFGGACPTSVSGTVMDPGQNVGLSGITVYQPEAAPAPIVDPVGGASLPPCDTCASLLPPVNSAVTTDANGNFTLPVTLPVPAGPIYVVAQAGRWRRIATITPTPCGDTPLTNDQIRMPATQSEGDIPKMALVIGDREALECWLLKIGISSSEIANYAAGATNRIQLYWTSGESTTAGTPPASGTLWGAGGTINDYSAVILPCDSQDVIPTAADEAAMLNYANAGGRIFMDHLTGAEWLKGGAAPWNSAAISTWQGNVTPTNPAKGEVLDTTPSQQAFYNWVSIWDNTPYGVGWVESINPRSDALVQGGDTTEYIRGESNNDWTGDPTGNYALSFDFLTPAGAGSTCGRVIYNGMHVSQSRATGPYPYTTASTFPTSCSLGTTLSPEELALEYQFFQLTACAGAPVPTIPLMPATFTRDFEAACPPSTRVQWRFFEWQATIPAETNIVFTARTAPTEAALTGAESVSAGTATMTTTTWTSDPEDISWHLANDVTPGLLSQDWLRINMTFNPTPTTSPVLLDWRQMYDCPPTE
jgi:hypothetical protein